MYACSKLQLNKLTCCFRDIHVMPVNYSVHFGVSEYINSNAIIKVNYVTCKYLWYNYVNIITRKSFTAIADAHDEFVVSNVFTQSVHVTRPCKIAVVHKRNYLSEYYNDSNE